MQNLIKKFILIYSILFISFTSFMTARQETNEIKETKNVYLTEKIAAGNEWIINKGKQTPLLKPFTWVTSRTMSIALFPICSAIDMTVLATKQAHETPYLLLNKNSSLHQSQYQKNAQALKKTSLGLLTAPIGILSPDIVTHHFVPNLNQSFTLTPYGKLYSARVHVAYPESIADVQAILNEVQQSGRSISTLGKCMSQGKQAISNNDWNVVINNSKLNQITIDPTPMNKSMPFFTKKLVKQNPTSFLISKTLCVL